MNLSDENKYSFYGRLKADFPSQIIIDVTEICNLECIHCAHRHFKKSQFYSRSNLDPALNTKAVNEVREHGQGTTQYIRYTGEGEPLLHPHIFSMISYAVRHSGVTVTLTTNGTLLDHKKIESLIATGVNVVDISIDAFKPETYSKIRVNGNLEITRANVLSLLREAKQSGGHTKIVVSYIEQPDNQAETDNFEKFWRDNGADYVVIRRIHSNSGALKDLADTMRSDNIKTQNRRPCLYPWERIVLNPRGFLSYCPADWSHGSTLFSYQNTSIKETWQGAAYRALRAAHLANDYTNHPFCGQCPDWIATRWPDEGRSYANMIEEFKDKE